MNNYQLYGKVSNLKVSSGVKPNGNEWTKYSWTLNCKKGNQYNNLVCQTFSKTVGEQVAEGLIIELTNYIPINSKYEQFDQTTGQKTSKSFFYIEVSDFMKLGYEGNEEEPSSLMCTQPLEQAPKPKAFNVEQAYKDSGYVVLKEKVEEDNMDWLDELKGEEKTSTDLEIITKINSDYQKQIPQYEEREEPISGNKKPWD